VSPGPAFSVTDVERGWTKALAKFGDVETYNLDKRLDVLSQAQHPDGGPMFTPAEAVRLAIEPLGNMIWRYWPDVIIIVSGFFIPEDLWDALKGRPHKTVLLCTESPYEDDVQFERVMLGDPDIVLLNDPTNLAAFREYHDNVWYAPHAYDPEIHMPGTWTPEYACDFGFVGTGFPSRVDFFARVDWRGIDANLAGNWQPVGGTCLEPFVRHPLEECFENTEAVKLYNSSKISANLYRARAGSAEANHADLAQGWAMGPREVELAACGTFFLREPRPEGDDLFPFLPTFTDPREFGDLLRYYLAHDDEREEAARKARHAIVDRTFDAHARRLMQLLPD
jgi:spore maturation protein CgeB